VLFLCGTDPFTAVAALDELRLRRIVETAHRLMRRSAMGGARRAPTGRPHPYWVYGRGARPCRRCGRLIRRARQGRPSRTTYWCPRCQVRP